MSGRSNGQGDFTRNFLEKYKEDEDEDSLSEEEEEDIEDEDTFSLPSFSNSVRQQLEAVKHPLVTKTRTLPQSLRQDEDKVGPLPSSSSTRGCSLSKSQSVTSLKEVESQNNELRSENFHLKLRLYLLEKEKGMIPGSHGSSCTTGIASTPTSPSSGSSLPAKDDHFERTITSELIKKDNLIKRLQTQVNEQSIENKNLRKDYDCQLRLKDMEMERIKTERDQLRQQLDLMNSKKENMSQAINRQLKKIEKLLETTALYVQEIQ